MTEEGKLTQNINSSNINGKSAQLQVGSKVATVNGSTVALDIP